MGILADDADPMVSVMKVDKAPLESYADVGGLEQQIQEIKESVELPLTRPELYEEIGIRPPKGVILYGDPGTGAVRISAILVLIPSRRQDFACKGGRKSDFGDIPSRCRFRIDSKVSR